MQSAVLGRTPARIDHLRVVRDQAAASGEFNRTRPLAVQFVPDTPIDLKCGTTARERSSACSAAQCSAAQCSAATPLTSRRLLRRRAPSSTCRAPFYRGAALQPPTSWQMHATSHCHMHQLADACHIALLHAPAGRCMPHHIAICGWLQRSIPQCRDLFTAAFIQHA